MATSCASLQVATPGGSDTEALRAVAREMAESWNAHDMRRFAALFTNDADFMNVAATHWKGREQIEAEHTRLHAGQFRESMLAVDEVAVQFPTRDMALVHVRWNIRGDRNADDTARQPRGGVFSWVVLRTSQGWRIRSAHNTNKPAPVGAAG
ncbi:MAG TPA: SgcJ/EcaC family oxidoreductase [Opitutaceae bacterium]|nr:SgcJ/EcaC family oxidoreductase [Opitutaceae bacterium]